MSNENVAIEKNFPVSVSELYKAWTEEQALKSWWKPAGRKLNSVSADLSEGGTIKYTFEDDANSDGQLVIDGNYETVEPEKELVYTWNWSLNGAPVENGENKLHVSFMEDGDGSKLSVTQETQGNDGGIHPHKEGWETSLEDLEQYLSAK